MIPLLLILAQAPVYPAEKEPLLDPMRVAEIVFRVAFDEPRDESEQMDILIVWSAAANFGQANAQLAVNGANVAYANSQIRGRLRLVGTGQVSYQESSGMNPLQWMVGTGRPEIEALRDAVGADLVHLVTTNNACGQGYVNASQPYAYSQSERSCAIDNLTFAHEVGHNQSAHHDPPNACGQPTCSGDNYGHSWGPARDVMAYPSAGGTRVPWFSNPNVLHSGQPTGIVGQRDNARNINLQAARIAAFKAPVSTISAPTNHSTQE